MSEWVNITELSKILNIKVETLRRGCVSGKYISRYTKCGKFKNYEIDIESLPDQYLKKYNSHFSKIDYVNINSEEYINAPEWQKIQANKYLKLLSITDLKLQ